MYTNLFAVCHCAAYIQFQQVSIDFLPGIIIGFESGSAIVNEEDGTAEVCVVLVEGILEREVPLTLRTSNNTATGTKLLFDATRNICTDG